VVGFAGTRKVKREVERIGYGNTTDWYGAARKDPLCRDRRPKVRLYSMDLVICTRCSETFICVESLRFVDDIHLTDCLMSNLVRSDSMKVQVQTV
jgi:hypothetical protein